MPTSNFPMLSPLSLDPQMTMDIVNLLPSPPQAFGLALCMITSIFIANYCRTAGERSPVCLDVDMESGFFPRNQLPPLSGMFEIWEKALSQAMETLYLGEDECESALKQRQNGELWRNDVKSWPVFDTRVLQADMRLLRRAHLVLAWLVHFFVHSMPPSEKESPAVASKSLAIPLVEVSRALKIAPVLTFADTMLWNWELVYSDHPMSMENIRFVNLFSGTEHERNFYFASARAELRGVEVLRIIRDYHNLPNVTDFASVAQVSRSLTRLAGIIEDISQIIQSVRINCDPYVFYWDIRPWYQGSDGNGRKAWIYEGVDNTEKLDLSGPSAGQSSVMHALDIFLDVDHKLGSSRFPALSESNKMAENGFMDRMRRYMPGKHREYLAHLAATHRPIRDLAQWTPALREPYNEAVSALKRLRDQHIRIPCLYIVTMSRSTNSARAGCPVRAEDKLEDRKALRTGPVRGTGGNELSFLLKAGRDATRRTLLEDNCEY